MKAILEQDLDPSVRIYSEFPSTEAPNLAIPCVIIQEIGGRGSGVGHGEATEGQRQGQVLLFEIQIDVYHVSGEMRDALTDAVLRSIWKNREVFRSEWGILVDPVTNPHDRPPEEPIPNYLFGKSMSFPMTIEMTRLE